jgi:hypothetical protein
VGWGGWRAMRAGWGEPAISDQQSVIRRKREILMTDY